LSARKWSWLAWSIAAASILLIAAWIAPVLFRVTDTASRATPAPRTNALVLAVLPADAGVPPWVAPAALELFGQHLADSRLRLLRSDALGLVDRAQDVRWQHQAHDLLDADHALGGRWHVEADGALSLDLSLIDLADGRVVVSRRIEGSPENLGAI